MLWLIALLAVSQGKSPQAIPKLDGIYPNFGYACHPKTSSDSGYFRYLVYLPDQKPIGMPQRARVLLTDGTPSSLPQREITIDGHITRLLVPQPQGTAERRMAMWASLDAASAEDQPVRASFQMFLSAVEVKQADGTYVMRLAPTNGWLNLYNAAGKLDRELSVKCDDITGRAAPKIE